MMEGEKDQDKTKQDMKSVISLGKDTRQPQER